MARSPVPPPTAAQAPLGGTTAGAPPPLEPKPWWRKPEIIVAILGVIVALGALGVYFYSARQTDVRNRLDAVNSLTEKSNTLVKRFSDSGIDDVPELARFFLLLGSNHQDHVISQPFFETQIRIWCPITRRAHEKLEIAWVKNKNFQDVHQATPWYLDLLSKMVGTSSDVKGGCL